MAQPLLKSTVDVLVVGVWELSSQILALEHHACFAQIQRDRQGPRGRLSGRHHGQIIPEGVRDREPRISHSLIDRLAASWRSAARG